MLNYSNRMSLLKASAIREILKLTEKPGVISFAGGLPAPELFPIDEMKKVSEIVLEEMGQQALQYSTTEGYTPLREKIASRMAKFNVAANAEDILVISGSQQGLDFSGKIFLNPDDVVLVESPSYLGAINALRGYECKFLEVPTENDGMNMAGLREMLETTDNVKMIYVIPDFQNPTGRRWSVEKRKELVSIANEFNMPVIEDNPYAEVLFEGDMLPAVKSFDTEGRVVFLGSFSKIFAPGLRIGWVNASPDVLDKYIKVKQGADLQSSSISQRQLDKYLELYDIDEHIAKLIGVYKRRRDVMLEAMEEHFPKGVSYTKPLGGLFIWVTLPRGLDAKVVLEEAIKQNVACVPGGPFFPNGGNDNTMRINYSNMPIDKIKTGIERLGAVLSELVK